MDFFAFVALAAVAFLLLAVTAVTRARFDRKRRMEEEWERYRTDEERET